LDFIREEQIRRNRDSRSAWQLYAVHRENVTTLLMKQPARPDSRLCVLGAGNCNDLDLNKLRSHFQQIHLVDLDGEALLAGCQAQGFESDPNIICHAGIDVTGIMPLMTQWHPDAPVSEAGMQSTLKAALTPMPLPVESGSFDVVASVGLLTQLIEAVNLSLGATHPQYLNLVTNIRLRHMRLLLELLRPGGMSWLFNEIVSSSTCPALLTVTHQELLPLVNRSINQGNFFTGCNPAVLMQIYQRDPELHDNMQSLTVSHPWLWKFLYRTYAVCAFGALKKLGWEISRHSPLTNTTDRDC
jgi:hypothetical protein